MQAKRRTLTGDTVVGVDFPLDIMLARGMITREMHEAGHRFAALAWSLYGAPFAGCEAIYQRMVSAGLGDIGTPRTGTDGDAEMAKRDKGREERYGAMVLALRPPGASREILSAVQGAAQYLRLPRMVIGIATGAQIRPSDHREMRALREGLERLVDASDRRVKKAA